MTKKVYFLLKKFGYSKKKHYLCRRKAYAKAMTNVNTISAIRALGREILPKGSRLWLYGSHARDDFHEHSDWDILLLVDKDKLSDDDFNQLSYPFIELGVERGQYFSPQMYTKKEWNNMSFLPFYKNVEHDKIEII